MTLRPAALLPLDRAVDLGRQHGVHTCICMHRVPGYCVNGRELEPFLLFDSPPDSYHRALDAAVFQWKVLAERYKDVPSSQVSFDLMNEPPFMPDQTRYVEIIKALIGSIRSVSPDRFIFANGADLGQTPVLGLIDEGIIQSTHDYQPKMVTHYKAGWVPEREFESHEKPTWPMVDMHGVLWDKEKLRAEDITKWKPLTDVGAPVHVGEWGVVPQTPHDVALAFMADELSLWKEAGWGWSLWNLRGGFGIVDSGRADVAYEAFDGHKLDRRMLELLRQAEHSALAPPGRPAAPARARPPRGRSGWSGRGISRCSPWAAEAPCRRASLQFIPVPGQTRSGEQLGYIPRVPHDAAVLQVAESW